MVTMMLYNAFAVGVFAYVAVVFERWWIALFAVLFIQRIVITERRVEKGEEKSEEKSEEGSEDASGR